MVGWIYYESEQWKIFEFTSRAKALAEIHHSRMNTDAQPYVYVKQTFSTDCYRYGRCNCATEVMPESRTRKVSGGFTIRREYATRIAYPTQRHFRPPRRMA